MNEIMIVVYENDELVVEINRAELESHIALELNMLNHEREAGLPPSLIVVSEAKNGFKICYHEDGIWIMKNDEVYPIPMDVLISLLNNDEKLIIDWKKEKKERAWWLDYVNVYKLTGIKPSVKYKEIGDMLDVFKVKIERSKKKKRKV